MITFSCLVEAFARTILLFLFRFGGERLSAVCAFLFVHGALQIALRIPPAEIAALVAEVLLLVSLRMRQCGTAVFTAQHVRIRIRLAAEVAFYGADGNPRYFCRFGYRHSVLTTRKNLLSLFFGHFQKPLSLYGHENGLSKPPKIKKLQTHQK